MSHPKLVIGIGMPKTGTNSLIEYLRKLGYKGFHSKTYAVELLKKNPDTEHVLDLFPGYDAFADYPFNLYYKEIEQNYPEAVFIWTVRPREDWLESWKKHDLRMKGNTKRTDYFVSLYDQHAVEIPAYFKDKPEKLLTVDLYDTEKAKEISEFLGFSQVYEFPHSNKTPK